MSPDALGAVLGLPFAVATIAASRRYRTDETVWPLFLAALPLFYMAFGALALDARAIGLEFLVGLPFIAVGLWCWRGELASVRVVLGLGWIAHGAYDLGHDLLFVNPGVFAGYPVFCAVIDVVVGGYLLASRSPGSRPQLSPSP